MDMRRRGTLVALALLPVGMAGRGSAASAPAGPPVLQLRPCDGVAPPAPPLRYRDDPGVAVLRVPRDTPVRIAIENSLSRPTSLDLHGLRVPAALGGGGPLGGAVAPGASAEAALRAPDSGTFWFHPWILDPALDDTAAGLAGVLVVEDRTPLDVDVDLVALLSDPVAVVGGAAPLIDRSPLPRRETLRPGSRVRLRLVNGSTRRIVTVACIGAEPRVLAIDGQPSSLFRPRGDALPLCPGGRCDLVFDLGRGLGDEVRVLAGSGQARDLALALRAEGEPRAPRGPVAALPPNPALPQAIALERATRVTLAAGMRPGDPVTWAINGTSGIALPKAPLFRVKRGAPVTLALKNDGPDLVAFRVHGACLRRLHDRDDGWEPYWLDAVLVEPGATHHAAFVADLAGRWLIESPFFQQAAGGLRSWFEVT